MADPKTFHLLISNPEKSFFDGDAKSLTCKNDQGPFDILPAHAHFITLIKDVQVEVVDKDGKPVAYHVNRGLISCHEDKVRVFVDL